MAPERATPGTHHLDDRTVALVQLAALIALDAPPAAYRRVVTAAHAAGAGVDDLVDTLLTVGPSVGLARAVAAAPSLASALGHDIDRALEDVDGAAGDAWGC